MRPNDSSSDKPNGTSGSIQSKDFSRRRFVLAGLATAFAATSKGVSGMNIPDGKTEQAGKAPKISNGIYNVKEFGAKGDSNTLDTLSINKTIETCSVNGGGTVLFPPGVYRTGTIYLKSNLTIYIEAGATILGSRDMSDYQDVIGKERNRASQWNAALLQGHDLQNVAIAGRGTIDGNDVYNPDGEEKMRGPHAIFFNKCEGILIQDIFVRNAGNYAHLMKGCSNGSLRGVTVTGGWDGIDLFDCKNFLITDCQFMTGDDSIAGGGWEKVIVSNCTLNSSCNGYRNYNGGLKNVLFTNLVISGPGAFKHRTHETKSREQYLTTHFDWHGDNDSLSGFWLAGNGVIDNLVISNVSISGVRCPLWICVQGRNSAMRNIQISNLTATDVGKPRVASLIQGNADKPIENISLTNITILSAGGGTKDMIDKPVPARVGDPIELLPCYGMFCRHIKDLEMRSVRFSSSEKDERPALICDNIGRLELDGVRGQTEPGNGPSVRLLNINDLHSRDVEGSPK